MGEERRDAGPYDREIDAAMRWVAEQAGPLHPFSPASNHQCALAAVVEWYFTKRDELAALRERLEQE